MKGEKHNRKIHFNIDLRYFRSCDETKKLINFSIFMCVRVSLKKFFVQIKSKPKILYM